MNIRKNQSVEAKSGNVVDMIRNFFRGLEDILKSWGDSVQDTRETTDENGNKVEDIKFYTAGQEETFYMRIVPEDEEYVTLMFKDESGGNKKEFKHVLNKKSEMDKTIRKWCEEIFGEDSWVQDDEGDDGDQAAQSAESAVRLTLSKVTSSTGTDIQLSAITSSFGVADTMAVVDTLVQDPEFVAQIPEGAGCSYEVCPDGDCLDVQECEGVAINMQDNIERILAPMYVLWAKIFMIGINSYGPSADALSSACDNYIWDVRSQIQDLSRLAARLGGYAPNPAVMLSPIATTDYSGVKYNKEGGFSELRKAIRDVINALELYYCNFAHEEQAILESWIHNWKNVADYVLSRQIEPSMSCQATPIVPGC